MSHDDFAFEPMRGLPARLPPGERLLWQGMPRWSSLAVQAYHVRKAAIYFGLLILWRIGAGVHDHQSLAVIAVSCAFLAFLGGVTGGVLSLLAYLNARSTVYTITTRRVLLRHGVAVPLTMNLPLNMIESADLRAVADGTGEIYLSVPREQRIGYLINWPHVRSGRFTHPAACLRALPDAPRVAALLGAALSNVGGAQAIANAGTAGAETAAPASAQPAAA